MPTNCCSTDRMMPTHTTGSRPNFGPFRSETFWARSPASEARTSSMRASSVSWPTEAITSRASSTRPLPIR